jgi:cyanate permease
VVINGLMVKQFPGREARALAVAAIGISLASAVLPPLVGALLEHYDWRVTLQGLAVGIMGILWLVILAGIPAGVVGPVAGGEAPVAGRFYGNKAFWLIGLCVAMGLNVSIVLAVCYPPLFVSRGYSVADAGWFLAFAGTAGLVGKSCLAGFGDAIRHYAKWLGAALLLIQIAGLGLLFNAEEDSQIILALSVMGFGSGAFIPMHPYLNSRYFDAAIISQVNGAQMPLFLPFALIGAPLAGFSYDQMGNYDAVLLALALTLGLAALLVLLLPQQKD